MLRVVSSALLLGAMLLLAGPPPVAAEEERDAGAAAQTRGVATGWFTVRTMNVRSGPGTDFAKVGELKKDSALEVRDWVRGEKVVGNNDMWALIGNGRYVYSNGMIKPKPKAPPDPPEEKYRGRWIDVNLTEQVATAYYGDRPLYWAVFSSGQPGWETPTGVHKINRRVLNETMDSDSLNVEDVDFYLIEDVYYTQFFTWDGSAIHYNYWKWDSPFGVPTSHGCLGMRYGDAYFFWIFGTIGTPLVIHY